jgi:1-pyrroline-5-carboxylate dehydrogenase
MPFVLRISLTGITQGSRSSGTNDKAGSINLLYRFVNARSIKESFIYPTEVHYPSNAAESGEGI